MASQGTAAFAVPALTHLSTIVSASSTTLLHPAYLPISPLTLFHAVRVSVGVTELQGGSRRPLVQSVVLLWILLFGGLALLAVLLAQPSPLLTAEVQWVAFVYGAAHVLCLKSGLNDILIRFASRARTGLCLDVWYALLDSICRVEGIGVLGVDPLRHYSSPVTPLLGALLIGGGGPLFIGLLNLSSQNWILQTPTWLRRPSELLTLDVWSSVLVGWIYLLLTRSKGAAEGAGTSKATLTRIEAQMLGSVVLFSLMVLNSLIRRLDEFGQCRSPSPVDKGRKKANGSAAVDKPSQRSRASLLAVVSVIVPVVLLVAQNVWSGDTLEKQGIERPSRVLLLLAHPDDEVMFFSPVLHSFLSPNSSTEVWAACLSVGQETATVPSSEARPEEIIPIISSSATIPTDSQATPL